MKTPEELAYDYGEKLDGVEISKNDINIAWYEGYKAAQEHAHAALEEAEVRIQKLQDQLADASKVMPQWISVDKRLPELGQDVLVIKDGLYGLACRRKVERKPLPSPQFNNIEIWEWDYGFEAREGRVTHWQELPEPPKGEE
jgi:hypothetical protein